MKDRRFAQYLLKKRHNTAPIRKNEEIQNNPDNRIDQDFPGYPHGSSRKELINPGTGQERKVAGVDKKQ